MAVGRHNKQYFPLLENIKKASLHWSGFCVILCGTQSLKGLKKKLFTKPAQMVFEMKILKSTDNELFIDFGFCPLVAAWQKLGCSDDEIARLCDIAMEGDRGIAESFGGQLELGDTIANGHACCPLRFKK